MKCMQLIVIALPSILRYGVHFDLASTLVFRSSRSRINDWYFRNYAIAIGEASGEKISSEGLQGGV